MSDEVVRGSCRHAGSLVDFAVTGPQVAQDPALLAQTTFPTFLAWIACRRATGQGIIRSPAGPWDLVCHDGSLHVLERQGHPFMSEVVNRLVADGKATSAAVDSAASAASLSGRSIVQHLFEAGACSPCDLVQTMRSLKQASLDSLMAAPALFFEWQDGRRPGLRADPVTIELVQYLFGQIRERTQALYLADFQPYLQNYLGMYPVRSKLLTPLVATTTLSERERKSVEELIDGSASLRDTMSYSLLTKHATARVFFACTFLGLFEYRTIPVPKGGVEILEADLSKQYERIKNEDFFTRLSVHWTAHPDHLVPSFKRLEQRWGPTAQVHQQSEICSDFANRILALVTEARNVLVDPVARRAYREQLLGHDKLKFGTEFLFKQAHMAMFREDRSQARQLIEAALDILPEEKKYHAFLAQL